MELDYYVIFTRLLYALLAGGAIGLERAMHGREAGFRTHALVCISSSLLMLLTVYQWEFIPTQYLDTVRTDPTRIAQGIMTGIGFLGAGVIIKEGLTVRGLTTAASIWVTAAIGIVIGIGFYIPAIMAAVLTVIVLSMFRWVESVIPSVHYARLSVRFVRSQQFTDEEMLRSLISKHNIRSYAAGYRLYDEGKSFQFEMTLRTRKYENYNQLAQSLINMNDVHEFKITPAS